MHIDQNGHSAHTKSRTALADLRTRVIAFRTHNMRPASYTFPLGRWGKVTSSTDPTSVLKVRIDKSSDGSFLIITEEPHGVFDTWVELQSDVEAYLSTLEVAWEAAAVTHGSES